MEDYTWETEESHADNIETMSDYLENHMDCSWEVIMVDGTYAEIETETGDVYEVHASGNGSFFEHRVSFVQIF